MWYVAQRGRHRDTVRDPPPVVVTIKAQDAVPVLVHKVVIPHQPKDPSSSLCQFICHKLDRELHLSDDAFPKPEHAGQRQQGLTHRVQAAQD